MAEWNSIAYEVYEEVVGKDEFISRMEAENKEPPPPGIFSASELYRQKKKLKFLFGLGALKLGTRPTHPEGCGAYGVAKIVAKPQFPKCEFFAPGKSFPVRLRHSNLENGHDAGADFRAASVKFADADDGGPLDLIMMTGPGTPLWNVQTVFDLMKAMRAKTTEAYKEYLLKNPEYFRIYVDGTRRAPDSYYDLRYYSKMIYDFKADDGVRRYARFRMLPDDEHPETGFVGVKERREPWLKDEHPSETRPRNYLKEEFKGRVSNGPIKYRLQIQLHVVRPDDPPKILYVGRGWDEATHPWFDVAVITMTSLLPSDVTEKTCFALDNLPSCMSLLPARSVYDYNCIAQIRAEVYRWTQKLRLLRSLPSNTDDKSQYLVRVETGTQYGADTGATISVTLFGTKGCTDSMVLDKWFHDDHERGKTDEYSLRCMNVGEVLLLRLHNDQGGELFKSSDWFVEDISVMSGDEDATFEFPCHRWITGDTNVFQGKALLPQQKQNELIRLERRAELHERQALYKWGQRALFEGLPGFIDASKPSDLPRDSQSPGNAAGESESNDVFTKLFSWFESWNDLNAFRKIPEEVSGKIPKCADGDKWMEDRIFGMQFLNGCNPGIIRRCNKLPGNFPVTDGDVSAQLSRGLKLQQEIEVGHIYIFDYKDLEGVDRSYVEGQQMFAAEPLGLFYVNPTGDLVPIAIQLHQQPSDTNPIWTPNDSRYDWLLAKMWLRHADHQFHQVLGRLLNVQLPMEAVAVATWRQLASVHPVYKLLLPHIDPILAVNTSARNQLEERGVVNGVSLSLSLDGQLQLLRKSYKSFRFSMLSLPQNLKERGVEDPAKLPNFYYRDDALLLWEVISNFVREVLSIYYKTDGDVEGDDELRAWVQDIHQNGFAERPGDVDHEFPASVKTRDQLAHLITCVLFNCSCQNAAVSGNTFEVCAFIPNTPPLMRQPPPTQKGTATLELIMNTLPDKSQAKHHVGAISRLSSSPRDKPILGDYTRCLFVDEDTEEAISRFHAKLHETSQVICDRNRAREWPYPCLLPESVSNTIH